MIAFILWSMFAFVVGYITRAITHRPGRLPNLYVTYQPTDHERRQFANYVDVLDLPAVRRRQRIEVVK